jgi:hypothetical protein
LPADPHFREQHTAIRARDRDPGCIRDIFDGEVYKHFEQHDHRIAAADHWGSLLLNGGQSTERGECLLSPRGADGVHKWKSSAGKFEGMMMTIQERPIEERYIPSRIIVRISLPPQIQGLESGAHRLGVADRIA